MAYMIISGEKYGTYTKVEIETEIGSLQHLCYPCNKWRLHSCTYPEVVFVRVEIDTVISFEVNNSKLLSKATEVTEIVL